MSISPEYHEFTWSFAETALDQVRALHLSAAPRYYEIWFIYAAGYNANLNKAVNERLSLNGSLTDQDLDQIYESCIGSSHAGDWSNLVARRLVNEADTLGKSFSDMAHHGLNFGRTLSNGLNELDEDSNCKPTNLLVDALANALFEMQGYNAALTNQLGASQSELNSLQHDVEQARADSLTDQLTNVGNRIHFDREMEKATAQSRQSRKPLSLIMFDVDHFKSFNDNFGHLLGDKVLKLVGAMLRQHAGELDIAARYGGEEFALILPRQDLRSGLKTAERIRQAITTKELRKRSDGDSLGHVTLSGGVAVLHPDDSVASFIERADRCLYAAKRAGRNRIVTES